MNTQIFKYVIEIEKTASITKAAENLYMGQPTLSKTIKELEASLGIMIFKRTPRGLYPPKMGQYFWNMPKRYLVKLMKWKPFIKRKMPIKYISMYLFPKESMSMNGEVSLIF